MGRHWTQDEKDTVIEEVLKRRKHLLDMNATRERSGNAARRTSWMEVGVACQISGVKAQSVFYDEKKKIRDLIATKNKHLSKMGATADKALLTRIEQIECQLSPMQRHFMSVLRGIIRKGNSAGMTSNEKSHSEELQCNDVKNEPESDASEYSLPVRIRPESSATPHTSHSFAEFAESPPKPSPPNQMKRNRTVYAANRNDFPREEHFVIPNLKRKRESDIGARGATERQEGEKIIKVEESEDDEFCELDLIDTHCSCKKINKSYSRLLQTQQQFFEGAVRQQREMSAVIASTAELVQSAARLVASVQSAAGGAPIVGCEPIAAPLFPQAHEGDFNQERPIEDEGSNRGWIIPKLDTKDDVVIMRIQNNE